MSEESPVVASFILTLEELKAARKLYARRPLPGQVVAAVIFIVGVGGIALGVLTGRLRVDSASFTTGNTILLVVGILLMVGVFLSQSGNALKRAFAQDPASNRRVELRFSPDGVAAQVEGLSQTTFQWSGFVRVRHTPQGFLFYQGPQTCIWVPEHAFASPADAETVAALARQRVSNFSEN